MTTLLVIITVGLLLTACYGFAKQHYGPKLTRAMAQHRAEEAAAGRMPKWAPDGPPSLLVVGTFYYQAPLDQILREAGSREVDCIAVLIPYAHEKDLDAVRVEINGHIVGHISRNENKAYRQRLSGAFGSNKVACATARVTRGDRTPEVRIGIKLA